MGYTTLLIRKLKMDEDFSTVEAELCEKTNGTLLTKWQENSKQLPYYKKARRILPSDKKVRAILISCAYLNDPSINFNHWVQSCYGWLSGKFIMSEQSLLLWVVKQENDCGYAHAILIPQTSDGKISYDYYFRTRTDFINFTTQYFQTMKLLFALKKMTPQSTSALLQKKEPLIKIHTVELLPEPKPHETAKEYYSRIKDLLLDQFILSENEKTEKIKTLEKENEKLLKELFPLYELTKKYGSPDKWQQMIHTALKVKYAVRASQSQGDHETVAEIIKILKTGEDYILKHGSEISD